MSLIQTINRAGKRLFIHFHDDAEFKETEHPRGKGGLFVKKGTGGGPLAGIGISTKTYPKPAPGAVIVNPIALVLRKHGYEKQKGTNIWQHPSGHEVEIHAATEGQKWLTGWTHGTTGNSGSGAGKLDKHLQTLPHGEKKQPPTPPPPPKTPPPTVIKPPSAKFENHEEARWAVGGYDPEPADRYWTGDKQSPTKSLIVGKGPNNSGHWQLWTKEKGVISTGHGQEALNEALKKLPETPEPETKTPPPPEAPPPPTIPTPTPPKTTSVGLPAKPPSHTEEGDRWREKHQARVNEYLTKNTGTSSVAAPAKHKKMLTDITSIVYDYMGVSKKDVAFSIGRMRMFSVNGRKFRAGGYFTPHLNAIVIGTNNHPTNVGGLSAHEIMHAKYHAVKKAYQDEVARMLTDNRAGTKSVMKPDGSIREEYQSDYPLHTDMPHGFGGSTTELEKDDGITDYSRDYWAGAKKGKNTVELAVNETLAEMANLDWKGTLPRLTWFKESTTYKPLYELIHKHYPAVAAAQAAYRPPPPAEYPKQNAVFKKAGFDRAYTLHGRTVVGYGQFTVVIQRSTGQWASNHGTGNDYPSLLKALEEFKRNTERRVA